MELFLRVVFFLLMCENVLGYRIRQEKIDYEDELSYKELISMNVSCNPSDSCREERNDNPYYPAFGYSCSCHKQCWEIGTCCIDSPYRFKRPLQECRNAGVNIKNDIYYMVSRCLDNTNSDSIWKSECEKEWNGEDNILMLSPVTSLDTSATYKNYFCFRCHESTDKYVSWNLLVDSVYSDSSENNVYSVSYNQEQMSWMAHFDDDRIPVPANLSFRFPFNVQVDTFSCPNTIKDCPPSWMDRRVHEKCLAYTAVVYTEYSSYKNPHCALCNYVSLEDLTCKPTTISAFGKEVFSFKNLLNLNDDDNDKVGKEGKCDDNHMWDPYSKKCRKLSCALPGYVVKDNKCVPP